MTSSKPIIKPYSGSPRATANVVIAAAVGLAMVGGFTAFANMLFNKQEENALFDTNVTMWKDFQAARATLHKLPEDRRNRTFYIRQKTGDSIGIVFNYASDGKCEDVQIQRTTPIPMDTASFLEVMNTRTNRMSCGR